MFYSQCPECGTVRVVASEEIGSGDIVVSCESCDTAYNLAWHLLDRLPSIHQAEIDNERLANRPIESELSPPSFTPDWSLPGLNTDSQYEFGKSELTADTEELSQSSSKIQADTSVQERRVPTRREFESTDKPAAAPHARVVAGTAPQASPPRSATDRFKEVVVGKATDTITVDHPTEVIDETEPDSVIEADDVLESVEDSELLTDEELDSATQGRRRREERYSNTAQKARTRSRFWALGCFGLIVMVLLQVRLFYLDTLFKLPAAQPLAGVFCKVFSCAAPLQRDLAMLQINNTLVVNHPDVPNAIRISTTVVNVAEHDQNFPDVQLTLTDPNGNIISRRTFSPGQYVPGYNASAQRLRSSETETFQFDISNPSKRAIGFEIELIN